MIQLAIEKGAGIEQLERLMDLQERWERNEARKAFVAAMAQFKASRPTIYKNKQVGYDSKKSNGGRTQYEHATLDNIDEILGEHLSRVGISYRWRTRNLENNWVEVTCVLTHELGHSEETTLRGPADQSGSKNIIQAVGSTITYLERYTLLAATGTTVRGMDDDGQGGAAAERVQAAIEQRQSNAPQQGQSTITAQQKGQLINAARKAGYDEAFVCRKASVQRLEDLAAARFQGALAFLQSLPAAQQQGAQQ